VQDWICGKGVLIQVPRAVGPVADDDPEVGQFPCQRCAFRVVVQHVPSQVRRAVAIGYVERDMCQDVVYQWFINSASSILARPQGIATRMHCSLCAYIPYGLMHGRRDLRRCLADTAKEPEGTGAHIKVRSAGLVLEQQAVVSFIKHDSNNRSISKVGTVSISDGFCQAPLYGCSFPARH
jgi:hypothetical protein